MYEYPVAPSQAMGGPAYGQESVNEINMYSYTMAPGQAMGTPAYGLESVSEMPVSSNYQSSFPSAGSKAYVTTGGARFAVTLICGVIVVGVFVTAVTVIVLAGGMNSKHTTSGTEEHPEITEKYMRGISVLTVVVPEFRTEGTPPTLKTKSTTQESTGDATEAPFTASETTEVETSPTTPPPTTTENNPGIKELGGMFCTVGAKPKAPLTPEKYSACEILFYDSLYKKGPTPFDPTHLDPALSTFLGNGRTVYPTELGIGFAYKYRHHLKLQLTAKDGATPVVVQYFLDHRICSFGIVDTPTNGLDESSVEEMLESLKLLDRFVRSLRSWRRFCFTVLAAPIPDTNLENTYIGKFSNIFTPDIVVLLSHYVEGDNTFKDCRVVPPTMLTRPAFLSTNSSYKYDLSSAVDAIGRLTSRGVEARLALSVTMQGRWTVLKAGQPAELLSECVYDPSAESFGSVTEVCEDLSFSVEINNKSGVYGGLYYNKAEGRTFSYDSSTAFADKLCRLRLEELSSKIVFAVYDVDYGHSTNVCDKMNSRGAFNRFSTLYEVTNFIVGSHSSAGLAACLSLGQYVRR